MYKYINSQFVHALTQRPPKQNPLDSCIPDALDCVLRYAPTRNSSEEYQRKAFHRVLVNQFITSVAQIGKVLSRKLHLYARTIIPVERALRSLVLVSVLIGGLYTNTQAAWAAPPSSNSSSVPLISSSGYPLEAYLVPLAQARSLQTALDKHHIVRLESGNYAVSGPAALTIRSGYKVYGLPNTVIPPIVVLPGTTGAVLSYLRTTFLSFPASFRSTHDNLFIGINVGGGSRIDATNAVIENNVFLGTSGRVCLDDSSSGYLRNNRFIRSEFRAGGPKPMLTFSGNASTPSYNNSFLMSNFLTPHGDSSFIHGQTDIAMVGLDAEAWNEDNQGTHGPLNVDNTVRLVRVLNVGGGTDDNPSSNAVPFAEIGGPKYVVINDSARTPHVPKTHFQKSVQIAALLNGPPPSDKNNTLLADNTATLIYQGDTPSTSTLVEGSAIAKAVIDALVTSGKGRIGEAWEVPTYDKVPDPAGPTWNKDLASQPDSTVYIQKLIDIATPGIAFLPAGKYYISKPLVMTTNQGLIGAGMDKTVIIAKNSDMDMIVSGDHITSKPSGLHWTLSDLTLQGGLNGVHHDLYGSGGGAQYYHMFFSHVTFRDMSNAGIFEDRIYGYDNNLLDHLNFVNNKFGFLQIPDPTWKGTDSDPGMGYMDKTVFYANQFINNAIGVKLQPKRPDYLDVWVNTLFQDNLDGAIQMSSNLVEPVIANSDFINNGGEAVLTTSQSTNVACVGCRFQAGYRGRHMLSGKATFADTSFSEAGGTALVLDGRNSQSDFYNSTSFDMPIGAVQNGYLFNNYFPSNPELSYEGVTVTGGVYHVISSTQITAPAPHQFLWGKPLLFRY